MSPSTGCTIVCSSFAASPARKSSPENISRCSSKKAPNARAARPPCSRLAGRHLFRIPAAYALLEVTGVRKQCWCGRAETEHGIFDNRFTSTHSGDEVAVVIQVVAITSRRKVFFGSIRSDRISHRRNRRVLLAIAAQKFFLNLFRESADLVARLLLARMAHNFNTIVDAKNALTADEAKPGALAGSVLEIYPQCQSECGMRRSGRIVVKAQQQIGRLPAVSPEANATASINAFWPTRIQYEMDAREEMHEQVARHAGAIIAEAAPAKKAIWVIRPASRIRHVAVPVDRRRRSIGRNGGLKRADCIIAIPPGLYHVELANSAAFHEILCLLIHDGAHALAAH